MFPFYGADGLNGTIAATEGSPDVVGTGTNWQSNNAVPTAGGYGIKMPDGEFYGIDSCTGEGAITLSEDYRGGDVSGGSYYIIPLGAPIAQLLNQVSTLLGTSNYAQIAGLDPASGDFIQYLSGTWTTRTAIQTLTNLLGSASEVSVASVSTADIGAVTSPRVQITGTTTITGLGTTPTAIRFVRFAGALTLTHNATSLILPGGANIATAAGDTALFASDASGNWRCFNYQRGSGQPVATALNVASLSASGTVTATGNVNGANISTISPVATGGAAGLNRIDSGGSAGTLFRFINAGGAIEGIDVTALANNGVAIVTFTSAGHVLSGADNARNLGSASFRFGTVYAGTGSINTSDETEKQWRGVLTDPEFAAGKAIFAELGGFKFLDAIADKGEDDARVHFGARAQKVRDCLAAQGLDPTQYAMICYDEWPETPAVPAQDEVRGDDGEVIKSAIAGRPAIPAGSRWGLRYDELTSFLLATLDRRLTALEAAV